MRPFERRLRRAINPVSTGLTGWWLGTRLRQVPPRRVAPPPAGTTAHGPHTFIGVPSPGHWVAPADQPRAGTGCPNTARCPTCGRCRSGSASGSGRRSSTGTPTNRCGGTGGGRCSSQATRHHHPTVAFANHADRYRSIEPAPPKRRPNRPLRYSSPARSATPADTVAPSDGGPAPQREPPTRRPVTRPTAHHIGHSRQHEPVQRSKKANVPVQRSACGTACSML